MHQKQLKTVVVRKVKAQLIIVQLLYSRHTNTSGNIIKHNLRISMNERTHFFIKICISHTLFSKGLMFMWCVRDWWRNIYSERGPLLLPISSPRSQGVPTLPPPYKLVRDASGRLRVPRSTAILCTQSKSDRVILITCSPSGYTPVRPECPEHAVISLFTQHNSLSKHTGVTRNEPKIHVKCYITQLQDDSGNGSRFTRNSTILQG